MSDAFDGAGKPFKGPSARAGVLIMLGIIIASFIIWNVASWGMELLGVNGPVNSMPRLPGAGQ